MPGILLELAHSRKNWAYANSTFVRFEPGAFCDGVKRRRQVIAAIELVMDLLVSDWFLRYGADAFTILMGTGAATPDRFATKLAKRLREDASWPTHAGGEKRFAKADAIVLASDDLYSNRS